MKISRLWKREKPLSLFNEPIAWPHYALCLGRSPIAPERAPDKPYPKNAPGPFYVVNSECMTCGYPHVLALDLIAWDTDAEGRESHCYFKKQPETPQEIDQAVDAINGSCCGAVRYAGSDPEIIQKLNDVGCEDAIDRC